MVQQDQTLSGAEVEQYCIEEIVMRAIRIQARLTALANATQSIMADGHRDTVPAVVVQLEQLRSAAQNVVETLNETSPVESAAPSAPIPLLLSNPVSEAPEYSIEKVLAKVTGRPLPSDA